MVWGVTVPAPATRLLSDYLPTAQYERTSLFHKLHFSDFNKDSARIARRNCLQSIEIYTGCNAAAVPAYYLEARSPLAIFQLSHDLTERVEHREVNAAIYREAVAECC